MQAPLFLSFLPSETCDKIRGETVHESTKKGAPPSFFEHAEDLFPLIFYQLSIRNR
jgi:hypothetical protein